jgi:AmmeMemoRadiSam system protein A
MAKEISQQDQQLLLKLARNTIQAYLDGDELPEVNLSDYSQVLKENGACFITLTIEGRLRGCVGSIEATQPLILDVRDRAYGAAFQDYRFPNLTKEELQDVRIEISCLTQPRQLVFSSPEDLSRLIRPGVDGVILKHEGRRGTFLPQVWKQIADAEVFLGRLCLKMGLDPNAWKTEKMEVEIYQTLKFQEEPGMM